MASDPHSSPELDELRVRRVATAEVNGRRVNEAIEREASTPGPIGFVCECGHLGCTRILELTRGEYADVRTAFDRFLVAPGHEIDGVDDVVERHDRHLVVVKLGAGAEIAARTDPRGDAGAA